ncbi:MAG: hypothetical protein HY814_06420 [Candidatus Riflebacteria bacterium]|nr:hypothetical protein [Candidatus Riflebacteria bacterium]
MDEDALLSLARGEKFVYFTRGQFPCLFLIQVEEGFIRLEVQEDASLELLLAYCKAKSLRVEWVQAVLNDEFHTREFEGFPGGKYVAHHMGDQLFTEPGVDPTVARE